MTTYHVQPDNNGFYTIPCSRCRAPFLAPLAIYLCHNCRSKRDDLPNWYADDLPLHEDFNTYRHIWDIQLYDENHRLVWAKDLADRYRKELARRMRKDYRERC